MWVSGGDMWVSGRDMDHYIFWILLPLVYLMMQVLIDATIDTFPGGKLDTAILVQQNWLCIYCFQAPSRLADECSRAGDQHVARWEDLHDADSAEMRSGKPRDLLTLKRSITGDL